MMLMFLVSSFAIVKYCVVVVRVHGAHRCAVRALKQQTSCKLCFAKHIFIEMKIFNLSSFAFFSFFPSHICTDWLLIAESERGCVMIVPDILDNEHSLTWRFRYSLFNYMMKSFAVETCFLSKFVVFRICLRLNDVMNAWPVVDFSILL